MQSSEQDGVVTGINVTPLVDIMLVLLIVFMVTAKFVSDSAVKVNLPKVASAQAQTTESITVSIDKQGQIFLMQQPVDLNGLKANLEREAKNNPAVRVTLAADGGQPYAQVATTLDAIKQSGVTRVALAAEK